MTIDFLSKSIFGDNYHVPTRDGDFVPRISSQFVSSV